MKSKIVLLALSLAAIAGFALFSATPARADGIIIPMPPICDPCPPPPCPGPLPCPPPRPMSQLVIRYHRVEVTIQDQVAVTRVDQVFYNPNDWAVEGTYLFPLPEDAAVSGFSLWVDGRPVEGEILEAEEARRTYHEIVSSMRDPALLEYAGRGAFQAHVFPIPPEGERRIELEYSQALTADNGLVRYVYPLNTEKFSAWPLEEVSVRVDIQSSAPIRAVYSPSHSVDVQRPDEHSARVGYEDGDVLPDSDFALYYSLGEDQAFHLLTYREAGGSEFEGYFLLLMAPSPQVEEGERLAKDLILILDRSGSMEGEKFRQAQDALVYILQHLNPEDRFNVVSFSTGIESYAGSLRPAEEAAEAVAWVERLGAAGSTDIHRALLEAAAMVQGGERPAYLIFLTDGLPTEGVVDPPAILESFAQNAPEGLRLFSFGVGYDVDTFLLDSLAREHHGSSTYVTPGEPLDEILSGFYARISTPVLTNLELDFGDIPVYDLYPAPLPDLFKGSQILVVGRYRAGGETTVRLSGEVNGERQTFRYPDQQFSENASPEGVLSAIPRLWATRKIGHLLNQVRLEGPDRETIDQIVRLSTRYGIVTPYTSYLVTEDAPLTQEERERVVIEQQAEAEGLALAPAYGEDAVKRAADQGALSSAEVPAAQDTGQVQSGENALRIVGSRAFVLRDGTWMDTRFDPGDMDTVSVAFLSEDYFRLTQAAPELADAFALGRQVIALWDGVAYEVVPEGAAAEPLELPGGPAESPESATATIAPTGTPLQGSQAEGPAANPGAMAPCLAGLLPLAWLLAVRLAARRL